MRKEMNYIWDLNELIGMKLFGKMIFAEDGYRAWQHEDLGEILNAEFEDDYKTITLTIRDSRRGEKQKYHLSNRYEKDTIWRYDWSIPAMKFGEKRIANPKSSDKKGWVKLSTLQKEA